MPGGVSKVRFLTIAQTWYKVLLESYEDHKANLMMGLIEKHLPDFLTWLGDHKDFKDTKDMTLYEFIESMKIIGTLGESSLKDLIGRIGRNEKAA